MCTRHLRWLAAALLLAAASCAPEPTGSARLVVSLQQAASASAVTRLSVTVSAADIPSITTELVSTSGVWGGVIGNIPAGPQRSFIAAAYDGSGTRLFEGSAADVTIVANDTTLVALTLQEFAPAPPFSNAAPVISSVTATPTELQVGGSVSLSASVSDANTGDTLSYSWTAPRGSFADATSPSTTWTAPSEPGAVTLTLTVSDSQGATSSVSLAVNVLHGSAEQGSALLDVRFNSWPVVSRLATSAARVDAGEALTVEATTSDADGDTLNYQWAATCEGTWSGATSRTASFTPSVRPAGACNNCRLTATVADGRGGQTTGTLDFCVSSNPLERFPPTLTRSYQSSLSAGAEQPVTFEVGAHEPQGTALTFAWSASVGSLATPQETANSSRMVWTAPQCVASGTTPTVAVNVTNAHGITTRRTFAVQGVPFCDAVNVMLLLDTSDSMFELGYPTYLTYTSTLPATRDPALSRCNNPVIDAYLAANGWNPANDYPPLDLGVDPVALPGDTGFPKHFDQNMYYVDDNPYGQGGHYGWLEMWTDARLLTNPAITFATEPSQSNPGNWYGIAPNLKMGACDRTSNPAECMACVNTKGYYLDPTPWTGSKSTSNTHRPPSDVFSGKFLNFYPPKFVQVRTLAKKLAWSLRGARVGLAHFNNSNGATLRVPLAPACDKVGNPNDLEWQRNRERIIYTLNADPWYNLPSYPYGIRNGPTFFGNTPLAESLMDIGQYFTASQAVFESWFGTGWYDGEFRNDFNTNNRSICSGLQASRVLVLTDGEPYADSAVPQCVKNATPTCPYPGCNDSIFGWSSSQSFQIKYLPTGVTKSSSCPSLCGTGADCRSPGTSTCCNFGTSSSPGPDRRHYFAAATKWFYDNDLVPNEPASGTWSAAGQQRLNTYVAAFGIDHSQLRFAAEVGGGQYLTNPNFDTLLQVLSPATTSSPQAVPAPARR